MQRHGWIDALRGFLIYLVVLFHVIAITFASPDIIDNSTVQTLGKLVTDGMRPLRMPLFFLLAGALAASALMRPWRTVITKRPATYLWVLLIWTPIIGTARFLFPERGQPAEGIRLLVELGDAFSNLWFLIALAVYVPVAKAILAWGAVGRGLSLAAAVGLYLVFVEFPLPIHGNAILANFVFFLGGAVVPSILLSARSRPVLRIGLGLLLFIGAQALDYVTGTRTSTMLLVASLGAILWVPSIFALVFKRAKPLERVGRETLPIYVGHNVSMMALGLLAFLPAMPVSGLVPGLAYLVVAPVLVLLPWVFIRVGFATRGRWLFELPRSVQSLIAGGVPRSLQPTR